MSGTIDIPEGRTNDFLIHGLFVLMAGGILFLVHWSLTVLLAALAVALFLIGSGIEIDPERRRVRVYKTLGRLRLGAWVDMGRYTGIAIRYTNESQVMSNRGVETNVRVRTYDLHVITPDGDGRLLHDFTDYAKARRCAVTMAKSWALHLTDEVQERRERAQVNAQTRRR